MWIRILAFTKVTDVILTTRGQRRRRIFVMTTQQQTSGTVLSQVR
jgi:hypothetical protein